METQNREIALRDTIHNRYLPLDQLAGNEMIPRHCHNAPYIAVVIRGCYEEAGDTGRWRVGPGDALFHDTFDAHLNRVGVLGAQVLNLAVQPQHVFPPAFRIADPDALARAVVDVGLLTDLMIHPDPGPARLQDWPDLLAAALARNLRLTIGDWAQEVGLNAATVSRGFKAVYGISPLRYRNELRTKQAVDQIRGGTLPFSTIAQQCGFADQAHMCRAVVSLTGKSPRAWR